MPNVCFCNNKEIVSFTSFNTRSNAQCPECKSLERHRMVALFLKNNKFVFQNTLHIAPEQCMIQWLKPISKNYVCGDIHPTRYSKLTPVQYLDITNMPFINTFDCVFASHILEHIVDDMLAMREVYKSLTKGGRFITMVPQKLSLTKTYENKAIVSEKDRLKHFGQEDHVRWYGLDFSQRLKNAGFHVNIYYMEDSKADVERMYYDNKYTIGTKADQALYGIPKNNILYECIK